MNPKACRNGSQAQLGAMRFIELVEKSHLLSLVKGKEIQITLEMKHRTRDVWVELKSFGLWLYVLLFFGGHDKLSRNKAFWEIHGFAFYMQQFWKIKYRVEMTAAYFVYLKESWWVVTVFWVQVYPYRGGKWEALVVEGCFPEDKKNFRGSNLFSFLALGFSHY